MGKQLYHPCNESPEPNQLQINRAAEGGKPGEKAGGNASEEAR